MGGERRGGDERDALVAMLRDARARTVALARDMEGDRLLGPRLPTVNPFLWELGHVGWFHERFVLRELGARTPLIAQGDALYDSSSVAHARRWELPLPSLPETLAYLERVQGAMLERLVDGEADPARSWLYRLGVFHEDMHGEAFAWARQTFAWPAPPAPGGPEAPAPVPDADAGALSGEAEIPGGRFLLGTTPAGQPFVFDNERWAHAVEVRPFRIDRAAVTNAAFRDFVEDGGYEERRWWDEAGWRWRLEADARHPLYWRRDGAGWLERRFHEWLPLAPHRPVMHVCWHEASAWCRWAGRRLPSELEWEVAAGGEPDGAGRLAPRGRRWPWGEEAPGAALANLDWRHPGPVDVGACAAGDSAFGCRQMIGNVWEWTASDFHPYPGFAPDVYRDYSEPWFGERKVLRGGAWLSRARMLSTRFRNFFTPERRDIFAGFRSAADA